jgi:hypothetical protein
VPTANACRATFTGDLLVVLTFHYTRAAVREKWVFDRAGRSSFRLRARFKVGRKELRPLFDSAPG